MGHPDLLLDGCAFHLEKDDLFVNGENLFWKSLRRIKYSSSPCHFYSCFIMLSLLHELQRSTGKLQGICSSNMLSNPQVTFS